MLKEISRMTLGPYYPSVLSISVIKRDMMERECMNAGKTLFKWRSNGHLAPLFLVEWSLK